MEPNFELTSNEKKDLLAYCKLNNLEPNKVIKKSYLDGFNIERYGLLSGKGEVKEVVKEIIVEKPVEVIKEVIVEKPIEVIVEKLVEVIKEVIVEKPIEVIKEVPKVEYVEVIKEVPSQPIEVVKYVDREVIKEVFIEKDVTNFDNFYDKNYVDELKQKILELQNKPPELKEVPVEVIKEIVVEKEVPIEVVKEVIVEKDDTELKEKFDLLQQTLLKLRHESLEKDKQLKEYESLLQDIEKAKNKQAAFLRGSNLGDKLY